MPITINHQFTNNQPDVTGTVTYFDFASPGSTATLAASAIVKPSNWNDSHAVTYAPTGQEIIGAFSNGGNVTFGTNPSGYITATAPAGGGAGDGGNVIAVSGSTANSTGTVVFNNGNNVTFGLNAGTVTASASFNQTVDTNKAGTGFTSTTTAGTAIVGTNNTNGLSLGVPAYLTTAAQSNHSHNFATTTTNGSQIVVATTNSAGATIAVPPFITTYVNDLTSGRAGTGFTSTTTGGTAVVGTLNTNGLSIGVPTIITNAITTARASNDGIGLNTAGSNVTWTVNSGGISLDGRGYAGTGTTFNGTNVTGNLTQNSNGLRLDLSVAAGGAADGYNSAQFTNSTANSTMPLVWAGNSNGSGNVTVGLTGSTITMSAPAGGGAGDGYNIIGVNGGATQLSTTYQFSNANNITFGLNAGTITASASYAAQTVQTQPSGNIVGAGFTSTTTAGTAVVATQNSNGLSMGIPTIVTNAITTAAQSNHSHNFATTTTNGSQIVVGTTNSNGATIGVPPFITTYVGQTTQTQPAGNIAGVGTTFGGTNVSGSMTLNSNGLALSLSAPTPGGGGAINVSAGTASGNLQTIQFNDGNGVTFGLNGSTVTASVNAGGGVINTMWFPFNEAVNVMGQQGQGTLHLVPVPTPDIGAATVSFDRLCFPILHSHATNSTGSVTLSMWFGLYSRENTTATRITLAHSTSITTAYTFSGTANSSILSGMRLMTVPWTSSIAGNRYIVGVLSRTTTGGANCTISQVLVSNINSNFSGILGETTNASRQWPIGWGQYSATTSSLPNSIGYSQIYGTNSNAMRNPEWFMVNGTA